MWRILSIQNVWFEFKKNKQKKTVQVVWLVFYDYRLNILNWEHVPQLLIAPFLLLLYLQHGSLFFTRQCLSVLIGLMWQVSVGKKNSKCHKKNLVRSHFMFPFWNLQLIPYAISLSPITPNEYIDFISTNRK